jgi:thiol-disulfide isomerase/thioredoxin
MSYKKLFTTLFVISALSFTLFAQEIPKNPITLYNEATQLYFARNYKESKKIFEQLIVAFPADTSLFNYYLVSVGQVDGKEAQKEATKRCLPFYETVPEEKRDQRFYNDYIYALRISGKSVEAENNQKIMIAKFPNNLFSKTLQIREILEEKDVLKAAEMLLALYDEKDKNNFTNKQIAEDYLKLVSGNSELFSREKVISAAERLEKIALKDTEPESLKQLQTRYLQTLLTINKNLRSKFPHESMSYLKTAKDFYTAYLPRNPKLDYYNIALQNTELQTLIALQNWNEAQKIVVKILTNYTANEENDYAEPEADLRADYAKILEGLKQINQAREQLAFATAFDSNFKSAFDKFSLKYPLSPVAKKVFDEKMQSAIEANIKTLEGKAKAKLAKEIINKPAKDFKITDFAGKSVSLADYKGKVLILNFWATWCMPCIAEFKELKIAYEKYANNPNVAFAMIATDEDHELVPPFIKKNNYNFPVFFAGDSTEKDYEVGSIPRLLIIDGSGKIRFDKKGYGKDVLYLKKLDWMIESAAK